MRFLLDTDAASSTASAIGKVSSNVDSIACNKYAVDAEDGIDFSSAKSTLDANMSACADRIKSTASIIENVIAQHATLQSIDFETYLNPPTPESEDNGSNHGGNGGYRGGRRGSGGYHGGSSFPEDFNGNLIAASTTTDAAALGVDSNLLHQIDGINGYKAGIAASVINKLLYANVDNKNLSAESKKLLKEVDNQGGYKMIDGRYVIACDSSVGNVGDVIKFTGNDGKEVECVVGVNTLTEHNKDKAYLLIENNDKSIQPVDFTSMVGASGTKMENLGSYSKLNPVKQVTEAAGAAVSEGAASVEQTTQTATESSATVEQSSSTTTDTSSSADQSTTTVENSTATDSTTNTESTETTPTSTGLPEGGAVDA